MIEMEGEEKTPLLINNKIDEDAPDPNPGFWLIRKMEGLPYIHHDLLWLRWWNATIFIFVLWNSVMIPLLVAFRAMWKIDRSGFYLIDYLGDMLFVIDIVIHFKTTYLLRGKLVTDPKEIRTNYLKANFVLDLLASIPLDLFGWVVWKHYLLRLNKLLRLSRVRSYFHDWEVHSRKPVLILWVEIGVGMLLVAHWMGCAYLALSYLEGLDASKFTPQAEFEKDSLAEQYLIIFYWAMSRVTHAGDRSELPETQSEIGYMILVSVIIQFVVAVLIGQIAELISSANVHTEEYRQKLAHINMYMRNNSLPFQLKSRVRKYYFHLWSRQGGMNKKEVLENMPHHLKAELQYEINGEIIGKVPFFNECNPGFLRLLVQRMKPVIYLPGDWIIKEEEVGHEMYFISQGTVQVVTRNIVVAQMGEGRFFGEIALLSSSKRTASIRALTYCDIFVLRKSELNKTLKIFPEQRELIMRAAENPIVEASLRTQLNRKALFEDCSAEFLSELEKCFQVRTFKENSYLYRVGYPGDRLYFLGWGEVDLTSASRETIRCMSAGPEANQGVFFGHSDFYDGTDRSCNAKTRSKSVCCVLKRSDLDRLLDEFPEEKHNVEMSLLRHKEILSQGSPLVKRSKGVKRTTPKSHHFGTAAWISGLKELKESVNARVTPQQAQAACQAISQLESKLLGELTQRSSTPSLSQFKAH